MIENRDKRMRFISTKTLLERFNEKTQRTENCWIWTGAIVKGHSGERMGQIWVKDRLVMSSRVAYELFVGPIPDGLTIDHICRNPICVNPQHLRPLSMRDNILCGTSPSAIAARSTTCLKGHPFDKTRHDGKGIRRYCSICRKERSKRVYQLKKLHARTAS